MKPRMERVEFDGALGAGLAARIDYPAGMPRAWAIFAHCFTCSKDFNATRRISAELTNHGVAVLRFDFTGLGSSHGDFSSTNFSSNVEDLKRAAAWLAGNRGAPSLLIGHSLGGAAVLAAAGDIVSATAVVTIGAPADAAHVAHNFGASLDEIRSNGEAEVTLGGRNFRIRKQFLEDIESHKLSDQISAMRKALLVMHAPTDEVVGIENAAGIFTAAKHPKSFISLDNADHLLTRERDAVYAARMIAAWAEQFLPDADEAKADSDEQSVEGVNVRETGNGKFQNVVHAGKHKFFADEPEKVGGRDTGPSPYDLLSSALGACTAMTLRLYADHKQLSLGRISVEIHHGKIHAGDCQECAEDIRAKGGKVDQFTRVIRIDGEVDEALLGKLEEIAGKCPVHRTLAHGASIITNVSA